MLIIFGAGRLPQLGEGLGKAIKGFKKSVHEAEALDVEAQTQTQASTMAHTEASAQIPGSSQSPEISTPPQSKQSTTQVPPSGTVSTSKA